MKNKKHITKIILLTYLIVSGSVNADNFQTCIPKEDWVLNMIRKEQEAERRRREEERKRREREICLENKRKCEEKNKKIKSCGEVCAQSICSASPIVCIGAYQTILNKCVNKCGGIKDCKSCS